MSETQILECVVNISEGRDEKVIREIVDVVNDADQVYLLHIDTSPSANRTVVTFAGQPQAVVEVCYHFIEKAASLIDMRLQEGVHPRIGAVDVCPLIPLQGISIDEVVLLSHQLAERVGNTLQVPIYLYEHSAQEAYRKALPAIRKGQYQGLPQKIQDGKWIPDYGPRQFNAKTGATVIGARDILVAFNISLDTQNEDKAKYIASRVRESGYIDTINGVKTRITGQLKKVRAIGWYMSDFKCAQVSMNLLDYKVSSPLHAWQVCEKLADEQGVSLVGSELIGLMPEACLLEAGLYALNSVEADKETVIQKGIDYLGLDKVKPFDPQEKILEYKLAEVGLI